MFILEQKTGKKNPVRRLEIPDSSPRISIAYLLLKNGRQRLFILDWKTGGKEKDHVRRLEIPDSSPRISTE